MKQKIKILSTVFLIFGCFACFKNPIERNKIVFYSNAKSVQDSLKKMTDLLKILPKSTSVFNTNYYFQDNGLYINNNYVGNIESLKLDTIKAFKNFNGKNKNEFVILSKYLKENNMPSGYLEDGLNLWLFEYRPLADGDYHDTREIAVLKEEDKVLLESRSKILDSNKMLYLLAPKDAKIR